MLSKPFFTVSFLGWMVFVTFSSLYSFKRISTPSFSIPHADKLVHFMFYFIACILGMFFLRELTKGAMKLNRALLVMLISMIAFGAVIEVLQHVFTINRTGDFLDAFANSVGAMLGACVAKYLFFKGRMLKWEN